VLKVGILAAPSGSPDVTYSFPDQCGTPEHLEAYQVPRWKTIIGFQRNYTLLDDAIQLNGVGYRTLASSPPSKRPPP